jgi:hypothetical protein
MNPTKGRKYMHRIKKLRRWIRKATKKMCARSLHLAHEAASSWRVHVDRMTGEPGYAQAFRDLIETGVRLAFSGYTATYIADQLMTAYVAVLRLLRAPMWEDEGLDWT